AVGVVVGAPPSLEVRRESGLGSVRVRDRGTGAPRRRAGRSARGGYVAGRDRRRRLPDAPQAPSPKPDRGRVMPQTGDGPRTRPVETPRFSLPRMSSGTRT